MSVTVVTPEILVTAVVTPEILVTAVVGVQGPPGAGMPENVVPLGNVSGTQTIDLALGSIFTATATGNCTWSFINPQSGVTGITLILHNGGPVGQTFPGVYFPSGFQPSLTAAGRDQIEFFSEDGWNTICGAVSMRDMKQ
ncbi:MAG: hypothetical protein ACOYL3_16190 [Desulfuromonadaceae bacterium]